MPTITAGGIATGLDVNSIISQLMALERRPLDALEAKQKAVEAQISAFGTLKSALSTFSSAMAALRDVEQVPALCRGLQQRQRVGAHRDAGPAPGRLRRDRHPARRAPTSWPPDPTRSAAAVGTGTLNFTVGGETFSVTIDATNNTLAGIRDAINGARGNTRSPRPS